jgi:Cysteine-rich secretory protein family
MLHKLRLYQDICLPRVFVFALFVTSLAVCPCLAQTQFDEAGEKQLVGLINQERATQGLRPVTVDQRLTKAARKHAQLMGEHQALAHRFDGEPTLEVRFADENLRSDQQAENVDRRKDVTTAHKAFMHSPAHRVNILNFDYNVVGVAVLRSGDHVYVTEDFAHRLTDYSEPEADAVLQRAIENYARAHGTPAPARKRQSRLRQMACAMALNDALDNQKPAEVPGVQEAAVWTTGTPEKLPNGAKELLSHPMSAGYSLGACFAPSLSHPGGVYWVVMVVY